MYHSLFIGRNTTEEHDLKNRLLYKTLELELKDSKDIVNGQKKSGGLQVVKNSFNETYDYQKFDERKRFPLTTHDIYEGTLLDNAEYKQHKIDQMGVTQKFQNTINITQKILEQHDLNDHGHNGILSALLREKEKADKFKQKIKVVVEENQNERNDQSPLNDKSNTIQSQDEITHLENMKLLVCITMFKEPLTQLQKSIDGVVKSLDAFMEQGISPHQIGICIFFDGIENIYNVMDENGSTYHENIIPYFKGHLDEEYGIKGKKTLDYQYWEYKKHKKYLTDYSPENIINMRRNRELLILKYKKHRRILLPIMQALKNGVWMPQDEWIENNIIEAMIHQHHLSKKYIDDRRNTAWVYQGRHIHKNCTMPIFYVFKFANGSKLSSHMWFFKGFCQELQPQYCLLMDCGAVPGKDSIFKLIMSMEADPKVGGVCGNMRIEEEDESDKSSQPMDILSRFFNQYCFSIQKCQSCEYDIGHILDKQYESSLNYIHVLPGAYSAYRYSAFTDRYIENPAQLDKIKQALTTFKKDLNQCDSRQQSQYLLKSNIQQDNDILDFYLGQVLNRNYEYGSLKEANMFLAEDRVLCQLLFCNNYYLRYIPDADVQVDACQTLIDLLFQRRRWINGSWFALNFVIDTFADKLDNSSHTCCDQLLFKFSLIQARIAQMSQYFFSSFQIVWLYMIIQTVVDTNGTMEDDNYNYTEEIADNIIVSGVMTLYIFLILMLIYLSLTYNQQILNNVKGSKGKSKEEIQKEIRTFYYSKYYGVSTILGLISLATLGYTIYLLIKEIFIDQTFTQFIDAPHVPQSYYCLFIVISSGMLAIPFILALFTQPKNVLSIALNSIHYFYYQPTYTHLFLIYSFCRIDDLSWGTKGLTADTDTRKINTDKQYKKFLFVTKWIILNCIASTILIIFLRMKVFLLPQCLILVVSVFLTVLCTLRGFFSICYFIKYYGPNGYRSKRIEITKDKKSYSDALKRGQGFNDKLQHYFSVKGGHF